MIQRGECLGLALEAGEPLGILRERLGQDLDGHLAAEMCVRGAVHLPHPADANLRGHFVRAEASAWGRLIGGWRSIARQFQHLEQCVPERVKLLRLEPGQGPLHQPAIVDGSHLIDQRI